MEVELSWNRILRVWWAFAWRNAIAMVISITLTAFITFLVGVLFNLVGLPDEATRMIMIPVGIVIALAISVLPIRLILGKDLGGFRLVLRNDA